MDFYQTLGVPPNASTEIIRQAYRSLALKLHPDKNPSSGDEKFKALSNAYRTLSHPHTRAVYDQTRENRTRMWWDMSEASNGKAEPTESLYGGTRASVYGAWPRAAFLDHEDAPSGEPSTPASPFGAYRRTPIPGYSPDAEICSIIARDKAIEKVMQRHYTTTAKAQATRTTNTSIPKDDVPKRQHENTKRTSDGAFHASGSSAVRSHAMGIDNSVPIINKGVDAGVVCTEAQSPLETRGEATTPDINTTSSSTSRSRSGGGRDMHDNGYDVPVAIKITNTVGTNASCEPTPTSSPFSLSLDKEQCRKLSKESLKELERDLVEHLQYVRTLLVDGGDPAQ